MKRVILKTAVTKVGASATDFRSENMLIFFQEDVPDYLADFCYLLGPRVGDYAIHTGDCLVFDDAHCTITAIGSAALENLEKLGHLTVRFDGAGEAAQPGMMHVAHPQIPEICAGTEIRFEVEG